MAALLVAPSAQREIDAGGGWVTGSGLREAARIIAWINIAVGVLVVLGFAVVLLAAGVSGSSAG